MTKKAIISPLALAAVVAFSPAAFAQTMIGDQEITRGSLPAVETHCARLAGTDTGADTVLDSGNIDAEDQAPTGELAGGTDLSQPGTPDADPNLGNPDAAEIAPTGDQVATAGGSAPPTDATSGNTEADGDIPGSINLQAITLADCQAAGLAS